MLNSFSSCSARLRAPLLLGKLNDFCSQISPHSQADTHFPVSHTSPPHLAVVGFLDREGSTGLSQCLGCSL